MGGTAGKTGVEMELEAAVDMGLTWGETEAHGKMHGARR
jgi:hypothetical protein